MKAGIDTNFVETGTFYYCTGPNLFNVTTKWNCEDQGNTWVNRKYNFDDLGQGEQNYELRSLHPIAN